MKRYIAFILVCLLVGGLVSYDLLSPRYRIVQKANHGGYWIQQRFLIVWKDWDKYGLGDHWYGKIEWAESDLKELESGRYYSLRVVDPEQEKKRGKGTIIFSVTTAPMLRDFKEAQ